jgi:fucose 4-O-acetylase-like acetyltransferase
MEVRHWKLPWLVTLGQTALVLYFAHQVIEETIIHRALGLRFNNWIVYWTATLALIVLCVYMGRAWLAVKPRLRALAGLAAA